MAIGGVGMTVILGVLSGLRGRIDEWKEKPVLANGLYGVRLNIEHSKTCSNLPIAID